MRLLYVLGFSVWFACQNNSTPNAPSQQEEPTTSSAELPADFVAFYERFHLDSLYQMNHIDFPLEGTPPMHDTLTLQEPSFRWKASEWILHKPFAQDLQGYQQSFLKFEDGIIIEKIIQAQVNIGMERRFVKREDEWVLIYYAAMSPL